MVNFGRLRRMDLNKIKLRHYIATHTFHSPAKMKEFKSAFKHRKKNSDWFNTETPEVTNFFFNTLRDRQIVKESERSNFNQSDYIILYQFFLGKGDFFFCHWYAIDEQAILDRLAAAGGDKFFITMATVIDSPKINVEVMQSYLQKLK